MESWVVVDLRALNIHAQKASRAKGRCVVLRLTSAIRREPYVFLTLPRWVRQRHGGCVKVGLTVAHLVAAPEVQRRILGCVTGDCCHHHTCLAEACIKGDAEAAMGLINLGRDVNFSGWDRVYHQRPAIMEAARFGHLQCVELLLRYGAEVDLTWPEEGVGEDGDWYRHCEASAAWLAATCGRIEVLELLLRHKANPNAVNLDNESSLIMACAGGHGECVRMLLAAGADANHEVDNTYGFTSNGFHYDVVGPTPLMLACEGVPRGEFVRPGAFAERRERFDEHVQTSMVKALLEHGAEPNWLIPEPSGGERERYEGRDTPLTAAIGNPHAVILLLKHGAALRYPAAYGTRLQTPCSGHTALCYANEIEGTTRHCFIPGGTGPMTRRHHQSWMSCELIYVADLPWSSNRHVLFPPHVRAAVVEFLHIGYELQKAGRLFPVHDIWLSMIMPLIGASLREYHDEERCREERELQQSFGRNRQSRLQALRSYPKQIHVSCWLTRSCFGVTVCLRLTVCL